MVDFAEVKIWGELVGAVRWDSDKGSAFLNSGAAFLINNPGNIYKMDYASLIFTSLIPFYPFSKSKIFPGYIIPLFMAIFADYKNSLIER